MDNGYLSRILNRGQHIKREGYLLTHIDGWNATVPARWNARACRLSRRMPQSKRGGRFSRLRKNSVDANNMAGISRMVLTPG
jgi:hypothetical protein